MALDNTVLYLSKGQVGAGRGRSLRTYNDVYYQDVKVSIIILPNTTYSRYINILNESHIIRSFYCDLT